MDPSGDHRLEQQVLNAILGTLGHPIDWKHPVVVKTEFRSDSARRFDISLHDGGECVVVLEVKCKTFGTIKQLERYAEKSPFVARVGFDEWNWPDLTDKTRFPLIRLAEVADIVIRAAKRKPSCLSPFLTGFGEYLQEEVRFLDSLRAYFIDEKSDQMPTAPTLHKYSQRFYKQLYWKWFLDASGFSAQRWHSKPERSGVWCAEQPNSVAPGQILTLPHLGLQLPGPCVAWIHVELDDKRGLLGNADETVGSIQLRIGEDQESRNQTYEKLTALGKQLPHGFKPPSRRPAASRWYYRALQRDLSLAEFRMSSLRGVIDLLEYIVE